MLWGDWGALGGRSWMRGRPAGCATLQARQATPRCVCVLQQIGRPFWLVLWRLGVVLCGLWQPATQGGREKLGAVSSWPLCVKL